MRAKLTQNLIRDARPARKRYTIWDTKVVNFDLRVFPTGTKSFVITYVLPHSSKPKSTRIATLGRADTMRLVEARTQAAHELAAIRLGNKSLSERRSTSCESLTSNQVLEIDTPLIEEALLDRPPIARNRDLAFLSRIFSLAETWKYRPQRSNPCFAVPRSVEEPRDRTLATSELQLLNDAFDALEYRYPAAVGLIRFACHTGLRVGEIATIRWSDIDDENAFIRLPTTKTGYRTHYLPPIAIRLLHDMPRSS